MASVIGRSETADILGLGHRSRTSAWAYLGHHWVALGLLGVWGRDRGRLVDGRCVQLSKSSPGKERIKGEILPQICCTFAFDLRTVPRPKNDRCMDEIHKTHTEPCAESVDPSQSAVWARRLRVNLATIDEEGMGPWAIQPLRLRD